MKILLIEDDFALATGTMYSLEAEKYEVIHFDSKKKVIDWINDKRDNSGHEEFSDIIGIFDVMLPDGNGFEILTYIRSLGIDMPVIFLTAMSDEINIVQGLDLGADDYITKPFRVKELMSRIKSVARRYKISSESSDNGNTDNSNVFYVKDIEIDVNTAKVYKVCNGEKTVIDLTPNEYRILLYFVNNIGMVLSRNQILEKLFDGYGNYVDDNTLSVYMKRLREKIKDNDKENPIIKTVRGIGYIMEKD